MAEIYGKLGQEVPVHIEVPAELAHKWAKVAGYKRVVERKLERVYGKLFPYLHVSAWWKGPENAKYPWREYFFEQKSYSAKVGYEFVAGDDKVRFCYRLDTFVANPALDKAASEWLSKFEKTIVGVEAIGFDPYVQDMFLSGCCLDYAFFYKAEAGQIRTFAGGLPVYPEWESRARELEIPLYWDR